MPVSKQQLCYQVNCVYQTMIEQYMEKNAIGVCHLKPGSGCTLFFSLKNLELTGASTISQILSLGSPTPRAAPTTFTLLLNLFKRAECKG